MNSVVVAMDLDGTVMHSWKYHSSNDICIERIDGEERGFMSMDMLRALEKVAGHSNFVPITSRSIAQYMRIDWPASIKPEVAFVANGAIALKTRVDGGLEKTCTIDNSSKEYIARLEASFASLASDSRFRNARIVDGCYAMAILNDEAMVAGLGDICFDMPEMRQHVEGKKIYLFPVECNKGKAVEYLKVSYPDCVVLCGGNSENDRAMGHYSDASIFSIPGIDANNEFRVPSNSEYPWFEHAVARKICSFVSAEATQNGVNG